MAAEIYDLRSKVGREAYMNHLRRKHEGKTASELHIDAAVLEVQVLAMKQTAEWMDIFFKGSVSDFSPPPTRDEIAAFQEEMIRSILRSAQETFTLDSSEIEKFMGPDWQNKF